MCLKILIQEQFVRNRPFIMIVICMLYIMSASLKVKDFCRAKLITERAIEVTHKI